MAKKLYIIDGHAHIYAAYFAPMRPLTSPSGEPTKATSIFTTAILGLIKRQKPDMLVVAMDSKKPTFRNELYADYKAHRPPMPDDLPAQIKQIEQILAAMNIPVLRLDGFEADDIIGTLTKKAANDSYDSLICSKDKDLLQLLNEHVSIFDVKTDSITTALAMEEKMQIKPTQIIEYLMLQGDTADNIPGVTDVGPKTALSWLQKYGSIENIYKHIDEIKGKRGENLRKFQDSFELTRKLVTLDCNVPGEIDYDNFALKEFDKKKLTEIFTELGFNRLLKSFAPNTNDEIRVTEHGLRDTGHDYQLIDTQDKFALFLTELKKQKLFAVDTETTSIDAMRADLVGMSFSWQKNKAYYLAVKAPLGQKFLDIEKNLLQFLLTKA